METIYDLPEFWQGVIASLFVSLFLAIATYVFRIARKTNAASAKRYELYRDALANALSDSGHPKHFVYRQHVIYKIAYSFVLANVCSVATTIVASPIGMIFYEFSIPLFTVGNIMALIFFVQSLRWLLFFVRNSNIPADFDALEE